MTGKNLIAAFIAIALLGGVAYAADTVVHEDDDGAVTAADSEGNVYHEDSDGNAVICGAGPHCWLAKYSPDGTQQWMNTDTSSGDNENLLIDSQLGLFLSEGREC